MANNINFGKIYDSTWWGVGVTSNNINWGKSYLDLAGGGDERFIITVKTDNAGTSATNQFTLPITGTGTGYLYDIETSDGQTITGLTSGTTITFPTAGTYDIFISGSFPQCYFNGVGDAQKLVDIKNFGIYALGSTSQNSAFRGCSNMVITANDIGHFENVTDMTFAFNNCFSLASLPLINTSSVSDFSQTFRNCSGLLSFPSINTSSGTLFFRTWRDCVNLPSFPLIDTSSATTLFESWVNCNALASFPANAFDTNIATNYSNAFANTNLTTQSIDDILVSLVTSGVSNGTFDQSKGQAPSATGQNAITTLLGRGWTIATTA